MTSTQVGIKLGIDGVAAVKSGLNDVSGSLGAMGRASDLAKGALLSLAAGFSVGALVGMAKSAINAADEMSKLSQRTGLAVQDIAGLQLAFEQSGLSADDLGTYMARLGKNMVESKATFDGIGVKTKDAAGNMRSLSAVLGDVADKFQGYKDGAEKIALANEVFGKGADRLIPLLNGGAEALEEFRATADRLGLTMDENAGKQAEKFNDTMELIGKGTQGTARKIAGELLPTLAGLADQFLSNMNAGEGYKKVAEGLSVALRALYIAGIGAVQVFSTLGKTLGAAGAVIANVLSGNFAGAKAVVDAFAADFTVDVGKMFKEMDRAWSAPENAKAFLGVAEATKKAAPVVSKAAKEIKDALKDPFNVERARQYVKAMEDLGRIAQDATAKAEGLTKAQAKLREVMADPTWAAFSRQQQEQVIMAGSLAEAAEANAAAQDAVRKAMADTATALQEYNDAQRSVVADAIEEAAAAEAALANYGKLKSEVQKLALAKLEEARESAALAGEDVSNIQKRIDAQKRLIDATAGFEMKEAAADAAKNAASEWKKAADSISNSLTDALLRGFESGKSFAKNLRDTLVNMFKTMVLKPVIQAVLAPVGGALAGMLPGAANAGGGVANVGMGLNGLSKLATAFGTGPGSLMGGIGQSINSFGNMIGSQMVSEFGAGMYAGATQAGGFMGAGGMAGTVGSYAMGAGVGIMAGRAIGGGFSLSGSGTGNSTVNVGTAIGAAIAGPIGAAIGGALGGLANRLFGRKLKDTGIEGFIDASGFSGTSFRDEKGGWFRSDKTRRSAIDPQLDATLDRGVAAIYSATGDMAKVLGLSASAVTGYTTKIRLSLKGMDPQQAAKAIEEQLGKVAEGIANALLNDEQRAAFVRAGESTAGALARMSTALEAANGALDTLNAKLFATSLAGADAAASLVELFGGADQFVSAASAYFREFFSEGEQVAITTRQVGSALKELGIAMPDSLASFRALAEAQDLNTEAGRKTYASLLSLAPAFASVTRASKEAAAASLDQRKAIVSADGDLKKRLASMFAGSMSAVSDEINRLRGGGKGARLEADFAITTAQARGLNKNALERLPGLSQSMEDDARSKASTREEFEAVQRRLAASLSQTLSQVSAGVGRVPREDAVAAELKAAREVLEATRGENEAQAAALIRTMNKFANIVSRWDADGMPETRL